MFFEADVCEVFKWFWYQRELSLKSVKVSVNKLKSTIYCITALCIPLQAGAVIEIEKGPQAQFDQQKYVNEDGSRQWAWLFSQPDAGYTIQLASFKDERSVGQYLRDNSSIPIGSIRHHSPIDPVNDWHFLLFGIYSSENLARKKADSLGFQDTLIRQIKTIKHRRCNKWKQGSLYQENYLRWCVDSKGSSKLEVALAPLSDTDSSLPTTLMTDLGAADNTVEIKPAFQIAEVTDSNNEVVDSKPVAAIYVDQLIDPDIGEEEIAVFDPDKKTLGAYNHIEITSQYYEQDQGQNLNFDGFNSAVAYTAITATDNYGDLRFSMRAIDNDLGGGLGFGLGNNSETGRETGLENIKLEQFNFPLSENVVMRNVIGTHKGTSLALVSYPDQGLVSQRFANADPDILGISSRISDSRKTVQASIGKVENINNNLVSGYEDSELGLARIRYFDYSRAKNAFKADLWATQSKQEGIDDDTGLRLTWSSLWSKYLVSTLDLVKTRDSHALLTAARYNKLRSRRELGFYYFGDEVNWVNRQIGDDNAGIYFRQTNRRGPIGYGLSGEYRQQEVSGDEPSNEKTTTYLAGNANYRLNRNTRVSGNYSIRDISAYDVADSSVLHRLRTSFNKRHNLNTSSNLSLGYQLRQYQNGAANDATTKRANYSISHSFLNDSEGGLSLGYVEESGGQSNRETYSINTNWKRRFSNNHTVNLGFGYNQNLGVISDSDSWTASLAHGWHITDKLYLSTSINYNTYNYKYEEDRFNGLFVENNISELDDESLSVNRLTAFFRLNYEFGNVQSAKVLGRKTGKAGAGSIRGTLFLDLNQDGIRQPNEKGLTGVLIYLNSIYPTKTDSQGEFIYRRVGTGQQVLFIDESKLPLPYSLNGVEFTKLKVRLRKESIIDIPVQIIQ